ncbi:MAG TPA: arginine--tRNA ligase [Solirubrobacteraceae bacterium]|nr:arginine--tRNA ligase [Solirubrobacteraceae bacterium]
MSPTTTDETPLAALRTALLQACAALGAELGALRGPITLERPPRADFGDYSTNAALLLAPAVGAPPREIAERLGDELTRSLGERLERFEVAGPGFLNLFLTESWHRGALARVLAAGDAFGGGGAERPERILIEFVSANPTGPLVAASGRHAAYGDALARILTLYGHQVQREYYFNDAGSQVRKLGESVRARARAEEIPEGGYEGDYVIELAHAIPGAGELDADELARLAMEQLFARIQATLERYGVHFDRYFSERTLHEGDPNGVRRALNELERRGHVYRAEGALWLRTTAFGDDKDRVLERSNGETTYFAADVAYMVDKRERGFERQINVFGADHHGYVARVKAAMQALGDDPEQLEIVIMQFVHLVERGERAAMSKRRGVFSTLDELIGEIGVDATRFFMLQRSHETTVDLDLDLAREQSSENPVYYVQYAHARIASVLAKAGAERVAEAVAALSAGNEAVTGGNEAVAGATAAVAGSSEALAGAGEALHPAERALIKKLLAFPGEIEEAATRRAPHRIAAYALELAQDFTAFYRDCHVLGVEPRALESQRIALSVAAQRTIARALELLGVSAPTEM